MSWGLLILAVGLITLGIGSMVLVLWQQVFRDRRTRELLEFDSLRRAPGARDL
jgi:hypothetical protein